MAREDGWQQVGEVQYRRGAIMGLTVAETFMLITFLLLMLFALWRIQKEDEIAEFSKLTPLQMSLIVEAASEGVLGELITDLEKRDENTKARDMSMASAQEQDMVVVPRARLDKFERQARLVATEEVRQLAQAAMMLDPEQRRKLTSLVNLEEFRDALERINELKQILSSNNVDEITSAINTAAQAERMGLDNPDVIERVNEMMEILAGKSPGEIAKALEMAEEAEKAGVSDIDALRARIRGRLAQEEAAQEALVENLRRELGTAVAKMGGEIKDDGTVVLPDNLLFERGSVELLPSLKNFLSEFCWRWLDTLRNSGLNIDEIRVEGHASSEWRGAENRRNAFYRNLDLSQRRAQSVLERCLSHARVPADEEWARKHVTAVGYSSSRYIETDGRENPKLSRRVVFNTTLDRKQLLEDIEEEVTVVRSEGQRESMP